MKHYKPRISSIKKDEIVWMDTHRCRHGHTYLEHRDCYYQEVHKLRMSKGGQIPTTPKIGFIDIEASNLMPEYGLVIAYCIKPLWEKKILHRTITRREVLGQILDKNLLKQCVKDMHGFDMLVGFFSGDYMFDIPYLRTRCAIQKVDFPHYGSIQFRDVYSIVKAKFRLTRRRLVNATRTITGYSEKNWTSGPIWLRAQQGSEKNIRYILDHCKRDVRDLERLFLAVDPYVKGTARSI